MSEVAFFSCNYEISSLDFCIWPLNFCIGFSCEIVCFLLHNFPCEIHVVLLLWLVFMKLLSRFAAYFSDEISCFWPLWDVLVRIYAFLGRYELCVWAFVLVRSLWDVLIRIHAFGFRILFLNGMVWGRLRGECWRLSVHDGLLDVACFLCASWVVRWRGGINVILVVVGESANALGDRRVCVEVVWFVSPACITSTQYLCLRMT